MSENRISIRRIASVLLLLGATYLVLGLGFHFKWTSDVESCRELRRARGEFVDPGGIGGLVGLTIDVIGWPLLSAANIASDGTPFATPCTHR